LLTKSWRNIRSRCSGNPRYAFNPPSVFSRLQRLLGPWRLAYLEALVKAADTAASKADEEDDTNEQ
jgi:hypothetical protein